MNKLFYVLIMLGFFLFSCGGSTQQAEEGTDEAVAVEQEATAGEEEMSCDEFLDEFEKWTEDYIAVVEAYKKDPTNIQLSQEYLTLAESAANWYASWTEFVICTQEEMYQARYDEISDKLEKRLQELELQE
jgi:hypothetical protein